MLRSFEPELETHWPFSAPHMDSPTSPLIEFGPWQSRGRQNDSVFSLGLSQYMQSSNSTLELEKLCNYGGSFIINNKGSHSLQHDPISSPVKKISKDPLNYITGSKVKVQQGVSLIPKLKDDERDTESMVSEAKRRKMTNSCMENLQNLYCDERSVKAPVRRSQMLGDKITALQQLVSPYGKTDTASVLHEASLHIKDLHEQIQKLITPNLQLKSSRMLQGYGGDIVSLRHVGLCLVPMSSPIIINLGNETQIDR